MKLQEVTQGNRNEYIQICGCCDIPQKILAQDDNKPEYYTEIYLQCQCGNYIEFILPVN